MASNETPENARAKAIAAAKANEEKAKVATAKADAAAKVKAKKEKDAEEKRKKDLLTLKRPLEKISTPGGKFLVIFNVPEKKGTTEDTAVVNAVMADIYRSKIEKKNRRIVSVEKL